MQWLNTLSLTLVSRCSMETGPSVYWVHADHQSPFHTSSMLSNFPILSTLRGNYRGQLTHKLLRVWDTRETREHPILPPRGHRENVQIAQTAPIVRVEPGSRALWGNRSTNKYHVAFIMRTIYAGNFYELGSQIFHVSLFWGKIFWETCRKVQAAYQNRSLHLTWLNRTTKVRPTSTSQRVTHWYNSSLKKHWWYLK